MPGCNEYNSLSRRTVLRGAALAGASIALPAWLPKVAFGQGTGTRDTMIMIFLGGGIDGLSFCVPYADPAYHLRRPTLGFPDPGSGQPRQVIDLDGFFGLPPGLQPLNEVYLQKKLLFVHATGADKDQWTRSHFDAQAWMEAGKTNDVTVATGWLGRHLATINPMSASTPLRGIGYDYGQIQTLQGGPKTLPIPNPDSYGYDGWYPNQSEMIDWLRSAYAASAEPIRSSAINAMATVDLLNAIDFAHYVPWGGAVYPNNSYLASSLKATAAMLRAGVQLEAVGIHFSGWDTHQNQGPTAGYMHDLLTELGLSLKAFYKDTFAAKRKNWTLVCMSEFGRNVIENGSRGTDHGYGNAMMLMGNNVMGGKVVRQWPGIRLDQLYDGQDLQVTIDYRDILAEVVQKRLKNTNLSAVFPGYTPTFRNVVSAA